MANLQRYVIIDTATNKIVNVVEFEADPGNPPPGFPVGHIAVQHDTADKSWVWDGSTFSQKIEPSTPPTKEQLVAYANAKQWEIATGGRTVTVNGETFTIATTEASMLLMSGKVQRLQQPNPPATVNWQIGPTSFVQIAAADFAVIAAEIRDFVQATFDALPAIFADIEQGAITTAEQIDAALGAG